ncbi:MAG: IclR family transcriptional regulator [Ruoffia tabacinasalis]
MYREAGLVLSNIIQRTNESAQITAFKGTDVLYVHKMNGPYYSDINTQIGMKNPVHATSTGKVLLVYSDEETIERAINLPHSAFTEHTITNPIQLKKELSKVRSQGYSFSVAELTESNYPLTLPVWNYENEVVCALSIVDPLTRMNKDKLKDYMRILRHGAQEASERLGYDG